MTGLCTRCNQPLGKVAKKVDGKLYHEDCWKEEQRKTGWYVWPTHWSGGSNSVQVDGHNTIWIDSDEGEICRLRTENGKVTEKVYARARLIVKAVNEAPKLRADVDRLLAALKGMWDWQATVQELVPDDLAEEVTEAIRLAEKEE